MVAIVAHGGKLYFNGEDWQYTALKKGFLLQSYWNASGGIVHCSCGGCEGILYKN